MGIQQDYATEQMVANSAAPLNAALLGGAVGVGGGLLANLASSLNALRRPKPKRLPGMMDVPVPVEPKLAGIFDAPPAIGPASPDPDAVSGPPAYDPSLRTDPSGVVPGVISRFWDQAKADPTHSTKMLGAFGIPALGGYLLTRGLNKGKKKLQEQDALGAARQDYQAALQDLAGTKTAGAATALTKLANEYQSRLPYVLHLPGAMATPLSALVATAQKPKSVDDYYRNRGRAHTHIGNTLLGANLGTLLGAFAGGAAGAGLGIPLEPSGVSGVDLPPEHSPPIGGLVGTVGGGLAGLGAGGAAGWYGTRAFEKRYGKKPSEETKQALLGGLLGNDSPGEAGNKALNLYLPALLGAGGLGAVFGYNRARKNDRSKETAQAITDWDRKQYYVNPPTLQATGV